MPLNVIGRHLCDIAAFIISDNVLFTRFLSQVDWISEKANVIAAMDKNSEGYLMLQVHLFDASKIQFLERKRIKTEPSREEQKQSIKLKRPQTSVFT